jgi:hypothetical protein
MRNECIISSPANDPVNGSSLERGEIFLFIENDQCESFAYLIDDADALRPRDSGTNRQTSERRVDLAERAKRAKILFS